MCLSVLSKCFIKDSSVFDKLTDPTSTSKIGQDLKELSIGDLYVLLKMVEKFELPKGMERQDLLGIVREEIKKRGGIVETIYTT